MVVKIKVAKLETGEFCDVRLFLTVVTVKIYPDQDKFCLLSSQANHILGYVWTTCRTRQNVSWDMFGLLM